MTSVWKVVGGADATGPHGIVVREGKELRSSMMESRLSTGSIVEELMRVGDRLQYRLLFGEGPVLGWVSVKIKDKALVEQCKDLPEVPHEEHEALDASEGQVPLELSHERMGDLTAVVRQRTSDSKRAPCAVILCPGNPSSDLGSAHAGSPLMVAVDEALAKVGIPVVRFDYAGVAMSTPGGTSDPATWKLGGDTDSKHKQNVRDVFAWTAKHISDHVMVCGYSYGTAMALNSAAEGLFSAFMSLSMGYNIWKMYMPGPMQDSTKASMEVHSLVRCPTLYVCGENDKMTPLKELKRLVGARVDEGHNAHIEVVQQTSPSAQAHSFSGQEVDVGELCAKFAVKVRQKILERQLVVNLMTAADSACSA